MLLLKRIANLLGKPFGINPFPRAHVNLATGDNCERSGAFDRIYREKGWSSDESASGHGSELSRTRTYVRELRLALSQLKTERIFDAPCGDLNWILPAVDGLTYRGGDIAPSLIADLRGKYPHLDLRQFDICRDPFPEADVWHCRDCLFHLPIADIWLALENFAAARIPYALLTTHRSQLMHRNLDIPVGGWRYLDLEMAPFNLPRPQLYLKDFKIGREFPRYVGVWPRETILQVLSARRT